MRTLQSGGGLLRIVPRWLARGALGALPVALVFAVLDFPDWAGTLTSFVLIFAFALPLGLTFRLLLHAVHWEIYRGRDSAYGEPRSWWIGHSTPVIAIGAACAGAYAVLAVASGLASGDWSP